MVSMPRPALQVTHRDIDVSRLPDRLVEGAALLIDLARRGVLAAIGQRLHIRRQGGYCGLDIWLFLFVFYTTGATRGLRTFWDKTLRFHHKALAAIAGRRSLSSPASLSRALGNVENDLLRPLAPWLLAGVPQIDDLLRHPAAQTYDATGQPWHLFDYDPTKRALRQRALPQADDLPEPSRAAAELGEWTVEPGKKTRRPDGTRYAPVTVRVVASIFQREDKAQRGRVLDGWQIELFAADLPPAAWPAPEAVAACFGRSGTQENRFAQEDRELGLDRIVSYHLPGQEFAWLVGLTLWNLRLMKGFRTAPPPVKAPVARLRAATPDKRVPAGWPRDPQVVSSLGAVDWGQRLAKKPGWSFDAATG